MPSVPLGLESYERTDGFQPETKLVNLFIEKDASGLSPDQYLRLQRPGLSNFTTISGSMVRGLHYSDGIADSLPVSVVGPHVYKMDGVSNTSIGVISNDGETVSIASTYDRLGIVSDGNFYLHDGSTTGQVDIPDGTDGIAVETINGYFVVACPDGTFYWLEPDEDEFDALNFATAESSPDGLVGLKRLGDELFFFGTTTIEVWQPTGNDGSAFIRASGRLYDKGCMARDTIQTFDNSLVWVGNDGIVYRASSVPQRISTHGIEERIRERSGAPSAFVFQQDAHLFYVLRIPGQGSFAFDAATGRWSEFTTYGATVWRPHVAVRTLTSTYVGDSTTGEIWLVDVDAFTDDGTTIERIVSGSIPLQGRPIRNDNFTLFTGSSAEVEFGVRWKDAHDDWTDWYPITVRAPVDNSTLFRIGAINQPARTFEVRCLANARVRVSGALVNEAWNNR